VTATPEVLEARVWSALAEIDDPEMPINLVDLGLVYGVEVGEKTVRLRLTFTAMGCPATEMIMGDIRTRLLAEPGIDDAAARGRYGGHLSPAGSAPSLDPRVAAGRQRPHHEAAAGAERVEGQLEGLQRRFWPVALR